MIRLVRCFKCNKRIILKAFYWKYDKFIELYPNNTACRKCSRKCIKKGRMRYNVL